MCVCKCFTFVRNFKHLFYNCSKSGKLGKLSMGTSITSHLAFILLEADELEDDAK